MVAAQGEWFLIVWVLHMVNLGLAGAFFVVCPLNYDLLHGQGPRLDYIREARPEVWRKIQD